jgi:hypothetical protein
VSEKDGLMPAGQLRGALIDFMYITFDHDALGSRFVNIADKSLIHVIHLTSSPIRPI